VLSSRLGPLVTLVVALAGCGTTMPDVPPVRPSAISAARPPQLPLILQFEPGDRFTLAVGVDGELMSVEGGGSELTVVVKRRFFVLMTDSGPPRISLDGKTLGQVRGNLKLGFGVTADKGTVASLRLGTTGDSR